MSLSKKHTSKTFFRTSAGLASKGIHIKTGSPSGDTFFSGKHCKETLTL